ncbi:sigma-70 family RNA polymerase sigma factor [Kitasatospora sp. NPDC005748]|uniref:sigma-70 family RNA polymerase sigma factor n=1 Tax=Kitasatospora sp. NPDC005748 TaxID=3157063 RepID=UPI003408777F
MPRRSRPLAALADQPPTSEPGTAGKPGADDPAAESDARLTARLRGGDDQVVAELYERHHRAALHYARIVTGRAESAEDLASEAFARTLAAVRTGAGPDENWRPYLLAVVRNTAMAWSTADRRTLLTSDFGDWADRQEQVLSPDELFAATAERQLVAEAYRSLPERWRTVLWHTVIEQRPPEEIAPLLGLTPSGVSSLAFRAREGLREAYLVAHVRRAASPDCAAHSQEIAGLAQRPSKRTTKRLARHLDGCADCRSCLAEMRDVNGRLRAVGLGFFVLWDGGHPLGSGAGALAAAGHGAGTGVGVGVGAKAAIGAAVAGVAATAVLVSIATGSGPVGSRPGASSPPQARIGAAAPLGTVAAEAPPTADSAPTQTPAVAASTPASPQSGPASPGTPSAAGRASATARASAPAAKSTASKAPKGTGGGLSAGVYTDADDPTPAPGDRVVRLRLPALNSCVDAEDVDTVDEELPYRDACAAGNTQSWYLRPQPSGTGYSVISAGNGGCLDSTGGAAAQVVQHPCGSGPGQVWQTVSLPGGGTGLQQRQSGQLVGAAGTGAAEDLFRLYPQSCGADAACNGKVAFQL